MKKFLFIIISVVSVLNFAEARDIHNLLDANQKSVYLDFEFDPTFALAAGFSTAFELSAINRDLELSFEAVLPIFLLDLKHYSLEVSTKLPIIVYHNWKIVGRLAMAWKSSDNIMYNAKVFQGEESLIMGYFDDKWYAAFDFSYMKMIFTKMEFTDTYRELAYADAQDGWYKQMGGYYYFSVVGGVTLNRKIGISARVGLSKTEKFNTAGYMPFIFNVGVNYIF